MSTGHATRDVAADKQAVGKLNFMERYGVAFLRAKCTRGATHTEVWRHDQIAETRIIERRALRRSAMSGAIAGMLIAGVELWLRAWLISDMDVAGREELIPYWGSYLALGGTITLIEIGYLYWLVLSSVVRMADVAGTGLAHRSNDVIAIGISRAALDIPNPHTQFYGIDPYARIGRWMLFLYMLAYRAKVGVTSLLLRIFLRRILARAALRTIIPFVAIPLYAVWNVMIIRWMLREVRGRMAAPIAIEQLASHIDEERHSIGQKERRLLFALVAEVIMRARDAHPSFLLLLDRLKEELGVAPDERDAAVSWDWCRKRLAELDGRMQVLALELLCIAIVLGGPPRRRQCRLAQDAFRACGRTFDTETLKTAHAAFLEGQGTAGLEGLRR